jgi:transposase-like protein
MPTHRPIPPEAEQLFDEVRQIMIQYKKEVDGVGGYRWPKSLKERIAKLIELGVPRRRIANETGFPRATIYAWFRRPRKQEGQSGQFIPMSVLSKSPVSRLDLDPVKSSHISIKLPNGIEISGLSYREVLAFCKEVV